jgi:ribosome-binding protein aMBF1 (putative translation factor)
MITGSQIRAARAWLGWSVVYLAEKAGVAAKTISRIELVDGVPQGRVSTMMEVKSALEMAGIEFLGSPDDRPGIRFLKNKSHEN